MLSEIYVRTVCAGNPFPRCNVKNNAFVALSAVPAVMPTLHRPLYASGTDASGARISNIYAYAKVKQILKRSFRLFNFKTELIYIEHIYTSCAWYIFSKYSISSELRLKKNLPDSHKKSLDADADNCQKIIN